MMATMVATTTGELPNTVSTQVGKPPSEPSTWVMPMPMATARPTTALERMEKPSEVIMRMPVIVMVAKTEMVAPPMTHCGMVVRMEENLGTKPATARMMAAKANTARLMTRLTVTMPTFWL